MLSRPDSSEYAPYYGTYISKVPDGSLLDFLVKQAGEYRQLLVGVADAAATAAPAPEKWSLKQIVGHVCDTERIMTYRALRFARGDEHELHGFEQNDYVREANFNDRALDDLLAEFESIRQASLAFFASLAPGTEMRAGVANGNRVTVRGLAYIVAGHAQHHYQLLQTAIGRNAASAR